MTTLGRGRLRAPHLLAVGATALVLAISGCSSDGATSTDIGGSGGSPSDSASVSPGPSDASAAPSSPVPGPDDVQYVALGDSYAAAPGVPVSDAAGGCFRSDHNYAHLVAAQDPAIFLTDVTCSGATSDDVITKQVPSLSKDTDLVTIGIGGNDFGLFTRVLGGCLSLAGDDPTGAPCTATAETQVAKVADKIQANIGSVLDAIAAAAPDARIVVVGYPALLPTSGSCPDLVPVADGDIPFVAGINEGLSTALRREAGKRDLDYVDTFTASKGHDVCSDDPWVNGIDTAPDGTIPFHPFAVEQAAVASMITELL